MESTLESQLLALIGLWIEARPFIVASSADTGALPPRIVATITAREPDRSQALQDARTFLALPKPIGLGLTYAIPDSIVVAPFETWPESISPLRVKLLWSETMSAGFTDYAYESFHRVGREEGRWKMIHLWDDVARTDSLRTLDLLRQFKRQGG